MCCRSSRGTVVFLLVRSSLAIRYCIRVGSERFLHEDVASTGEPCLKGTHDAGCSHRSLSLPSSLVNVAMTRARDHLYLIQPHRFYTGLSRWNGDRHVCAPRTRFMPDEILICFEPTAARSNDSGDQPSPLMGSGADVAAKLGEMWS